ncbi:MAG: diguanylate cyclase [Geobacteraceae bacterium GWC2_58_44]|nr:MAG: diguanylate cyclase [Geobacteraceae bacterium GWC2_58_44]HBG07543.1 diguanylate cyclase [Geobacter sp.]
MAARKGQNLLEQALRMAQASGRSHQVRLISLLRLAARTLGLSSATIYLPDASLNALTQRFSTLLPPEKRHCLIPYGQGCAGRAAQTLVRESSPLHQLHGDEPAAAEQQGSLSLPVLDGKLLVAVLTLGSAEPELCTDSADAASGLAPVFALMVAGLAQAEQSGEERRNLSLMVSLGKLLGAPQTPATLLPQLARLCTASAFSLCTVIRLGKEQAGKPQIFKSCRREAQGALPEMLRSEALLSARTLAGAAGCRQPPSPPDSSSPAICFPLGCNGKTLGTMTLFGGPDLFSPENAELAETMARLLSCALAEASCSERIRSFADENEQKLKELSLLYRMSNTMLSTIKLNKLIHLTLTALTSGPTPFFDRAMLFLTNERSGVLLGMLGVTRETSPPLSIPQGGGDDILSSRWDISEEDMAAQRASDFCRLVQGKRLELNSTLNIASQAVLERRLIYIPAEAGMGGDDLHPGRSAALAASPLIAHGQAVGAVMVDNALTKAPITQEDLRFLQLFTNQAGMAIENSMLYHKIEDANLQLSEAQENLLQKERLAAIGEMAAGIAHELKGPLVSIGGFAGRLARKLPQDSNEWGHADLIVREVLRLEGILSEILLFSKKATICYTRCNIADIVKESLAVVNPPLEEKQITVTTRFPRQKLVLLGDGQQLKQVFINILLNALDAMDIGGKLVVQVSATELEGTDAVSVKIADTGGGIPLEALSSIFTPFYTTKESGTGLGLPIANRIITNHGGKIQINNTPGQGVEFKVILPKHW